MLSSLQSQLAALKNPAGTAVASNRKHDQAVGRGVHFSVQTGKQGETEGNNRFRASLIYSSTKEAADVPLSTLKTQYETALSQINRQDLILAATRLEKATSLSTVRTQVVILLSLLASVLLESPKSETEPVLHCLEYLLRAHQLHTAYPIDLFWTVVAASEYPKLQQRVIELIDWAEHTPYLWMRPYVAAGFPSRTIISQFVLKETTILKSLCVWSASRIGNQSPKFLSFTAAILLQGLQHMDETREDHIEPILRILIPAIAPKALDNRDSAMTSEDEMDLPRWQLVIASAVAEAVPLSQAMIDFLCTRILASSNSTIHSLACVVSILLARQTPTQLTKEQLKYFLEVPNKDGTEGSFIGCPLLSQPIASALWKIDDVVGRLRNLNMVVAPLVASLALRCELDTSTPPAESNRRILALLELEPHLVPAFLTTRKLSSDCLKELRDRFKLPVDENNTEVGSQAYHASVEWLLAQSSPAWTAILMRLSSRLGMTSHEKSYIVLAAFASYESLTKEAVQALAYCGDEALPILAACYSRHGLGTVVKESIRYISQCGESVERWMVENSGSILDSKIPAGSEDVVRGCIQNVAFSLVESSSQVSVAAKQGLYQLFFEFLLAQSQPLLDSQTAIFRQALAVILETFSNEQVVDSIANLSRCSKKIRRTIITPLIQSTKLKCVASQVSVPEEVMLLECAISGKGRAEWFVSLVDKLRCDVSLIYALALLKIGNDSTRNAVVKLLNVRDESTLSQNAKDICHQVTSQETSARMGGPSFLSDFFANLDSMEFTASLWVQSACGRFDDKLKNQWLPTSAAALPVAEAMEMLEQKKFPLLLRWKVTGLPLSSLLSNLTTATQMYVFRMMKGVVARKPHLVISTGPSGSGGRSRSYSIGSEDITLLNPYPASMLDLLVKVLNVEDAEIAHRLATVLFTSSTWREKVFPRLEANQKQLVVTAFATFLCEKNSNYEAQEAFYKLPISTDEIISLFHTMADTVGPLSLLVEYIGENAEGLSVSKKSCVRVITHLFIKLEDPQWKESFVLQAMITALRKMFDAIAKSDKQVEIKKALLEQWSTCLISLFVESTSVFSKLRPGVVALLLAMCPQNPSHLVEPIVQCVLVCFDDSPEMLVTRILEMVLPIYLEHIPTTRRPTIDLYTSILGRLSQKKNPSACLLAISRSLREIRSANATTEVASFMLTVIAQCVHDGSDHTEVCLEIFSNEIQPSQRLSLLHECFEYAFTMLVGSSNERFTYLVSDRTSAHEREIKENCDRLLALASKRSEKQETVLLRLLVGILGFVNEAFFDKDVDTLIKEIGVGAGTSSILMRIWQKLLPIEFVSQQRFAGDETPDRYAENAILSTLNEIRESLQQVLPPRDFVASIQIIISSAPEPEIQCQAFHIFADRAHSVNEMKPEEASLFLSFVPVAVESIRRLDEKEDDSGASVVMQAALVSIEQLARACGPNLHRLRCDKRTNRETIKYLKRSLEKCTELVQDQNRYAELICSGALCAATLIRVLLSDSLPSLSSLLNALVIKLTSDSFAGQDFSSALFQVSMLRPIISIVETMPKFIASSLPLILNVILSTKIRESKESSVIESLSRLEMVLVNGVEPRLLLPVLTQTLEIAEGHGHLAILLQMIRHSTSKAPGLCIAAHLPSLVASVCSGLEYSETREAGGDVLIAMILKMNEPQLKKVYRQLCDWSADNAINRQVAFWSVSCRLAKELRTIFHPCFTLVFSDLMLTLSTGSKSEEPPPKKRRTAETTAAPNEVLASALSALEQVLRADSHQGGKWLRCDGSNERFESILECLDGLMLHAPDLDPLVPCITALGLAAGDDVFWKPLNHSVLRVCQVEGTPNSVRLGLGCLLALMKALGEEYLTLLPEILPVLAELLEDASEEIAKMAREVVAYAENLTGEDLEARLR